MPSLERRTQLMKHARSEGVSLVFHYVPLHDSPGGQKFGRYVDDFSNTQTVSDTLVRLPLFSDIEIDDATRVVQALINFNE
jgi:dTDP-4-amino-4,6-dideoxygalactose transaminase